MYFGDRIAFASSRLRTETTIGSLSTRVFETRPATGSELFSLLTCLYKTTFTLLSIFSPLEMISIKVWETPLSCHVKCSRPVAVRVSKTRVLKAGAYYCYCAYVLRISRYSDFLSPMLTNTGIFLRGLKLSGESRSQ